MLQVVSDLFGESNAHTVQLCPVCWLLVPASPVLPPLPPLPAEPRTAAAAVAAVESRPWQALH
jgi:hypothetical protein